MAFDERAACESIENYSSGIGSGPSLAPVRKPRGKETRNTRRGEAQRANKWGRRNETRGGMRARVRGDRRGMVREGRHETKTRGARKGLRGRERKGGRRWRETVEADRQKGIVEGKLLLEELSGQEREEA